MKHIKVFFSISFFLLFVANTSAQKKAYTGFPILKTQAEVDAFGANNYTHIKGWMRIEGENITNLDALSTLTNIESSLWIINNDNLENLDGLSNIDSIAVNKTSSQLWLDNNTKLENIEGLKGLKETSEIKITNNINLKSINGLRNVTSDLWGIIINENENLTSLLGLNNISKVNHYVFIKENKNLEGLTGLENLIEDGGTITLQENISITNLNPLTKLETAGALWITLNEKLEDFCGLNKLFEADLPNSFSMNTGGNLFNPKEDDLKNGNCSQTLSLEDNFISFYIYPNPTKDFIIVESTSTNLHSKLFDSNGKLIFNSSKNKISLRNLQSGIYFLRVFDDKKIVVKKIIKI